MKKNLTPKNEGTTAYTKAKSARFRLKLLALALLLIFSLTAAPLFSGCDEVVESRPQASADTPLLSWSDGGLFEHLPPPTTEYGSVLINTDKLLKVQLTHVIKSDFQVYVQLCGEYGYTHSVSSSDFFYSAKRSTGERVTVQFNGGENTMTFSLDASELLLIPNITSDSLVGMPYSDAVSIIKALGFSNIKLYAEAPTHAEYTAGTVTEVTVNSLPMDGINAFTADATVFIHYVSADITAEVSASDLVGKKRDEVEGILLGAGFTNVTFKEITVREGSSYTAAMNGQVTVVAIAGDPSFQRGQTFSPTVPVVVVYYTVLG